jgi:hypothetical protein
LRRDRKVLGNDAQSLQMGIAPYPEIGWQRSELPEIGIHVRRQS